LHSPKVLVDPANFNMDESKESDVDWLDQDENNGERMVVNPTYVRERIDV